MNRIEFAIPLAENEHRSRGAESRGAERSPAWLPTRSSFARAGVIDAIGDTPLVRLTRVFDEMRFDLYAKLEALNPGGSMKDRPAHRVLEDAIAHGDITRDSVVIESSSGNMGVGLAQACTCYGLKFICVVDPRTTAQNIRLMEAYGAVVDCVAEPDPSTGEFLQARLNRVHDLVASIPHAYWPNQYENVSNARAHHETIREIAAALRGRVDVLVCATSTCGTLRGCAEYVRATGMKTRIVAVDAIGSVIFDAPCGKRLLPGHGAGVRPGLFQPDLADDVVWVSDLDAITGCRRLARREGILAGASSGAVIMAVQRERVSIPDGANVAVILADRGERYLDTVYSDEWVESHFGAVTHLWKEGAHA